MRSIRFFVGMLIIGLVFFAFFHPEFIEWIQHHPILDVLAALVAIALHGVNTYYGSPEMRSWRDTDL